MSQQTKIKICGVKSQDALDAVIRAMPDFVGFVHWPGSPRFIEHEAAQQFAQQLPESTLPVGLFVNADLGDIAATPYSWVQLHGDEDEAFSLAVKTAGKRIIRGFRFEPKELKRWDACEAVDVLLVDGSSVGGEGVGFQHELLTELVPTLTKPVILAGGLTPENIQEAIAAARPWGVDVSSGVERTRGEKDPARISEFCEAVRRGH